MLVGRLANSICAGQLPLRSTFALGAVWVDDSRVILLRQASEVIQVTDTSSEAGPKRRRLPAALHNSVAARRGLAACLRWSGEGAQAGPSRQASAAGCQSREDLNAPLGRLDGSRDRRGDGHLGGFGDLTESPATGALLLHAANRPLLFGYQCQFVAVSDVTIRVMIVDSASGPLVPWQCAPRCDLWDQKAGG
jgi:hypothetical protein